MGFAQPHGQVHQGDDARTQVKRPQHAGVLHFRQFRDLGHADDFQHLGHIDAVVTPVPVGRRRRVSGSVRRNVRLVGHGLVQIKFHHFQFVGAGFQQNIGLGHAASSKNIPRRSALRAVSGCARLETMTKIPPPYKDASRSSAASMRLFGVDAPAVRPARRFCAKRSACSSSTRSTW